MDISEEDLREVFSLTCQLAKILNAHDTHITVNALALTTAYASVISEMPDAEFDVLFMRAMTGLRDQAVRPGIFNVLEPGEVRH